MYVVDIEEIRTSNQLKKEKCNEAKVAMRDILSEEQLERFEDAFYSAVNGYILKRKD